MKKIYVILFALLCVTSFSVKATVYTRLGAKPEAGWPGKYLIVYEATDTKAYIWDGTDASGNYLQATIANGKITADNLNDCLVTVSAEGTNQYGIKSSEGYIGCEAKKNSLVFTKGAVACTLKDNGGYVMLETNTNTCRFVYNTTANRFRFYYDSDKKWNSTDYRNIRFYVEGDQEIQPSANTLDINYAHAEMYACDSKFPTQSNPYYQYYSTFLFLAQEEDDNAVPQIGLEILAPTQYSIADTYASASATSEAATKAGYINISAGSSHSYFTFPSKAEAGYSTAALQVAEMKITKVGSSKQPNAYTYHIKLEFTDSNKKIWTLDKDLDVYAWWIDCDRSGKELQDMDPIAFALESGNHNTETAIREVEGQKSKVESQKSKVIRNGNLYIEYEGKTYNLLGLPISDF